MPSRSHRLIILCVHRRLLSAEVEIPMRLKSKFECQQAMAVSLQNQDPPPPRAEPLQNEAE
jgi:hypothetical protein